MTGPTAPPAEGAGAARWMTGLQAGVIAGLIAVIFSMSHATLVTGAAAPHATTEVIGMALIGTAVLCVLMGLFSNVTGLVPMSQDVPAAAIGAILVTIVADRANQGGQVSSAEVVLMCLLAGFMFSAVVFLIGRFRLAGLMRFAPRPVLAGFLAGTGFFVLIAALGICLGTSVTIATASDLLGPEARLKLLVALIVAAAFFAADRFLPSNFVAGAVIVTSIALFHVICLGLGVKPLDLSNAGWTAAVPHGGLTWPPLTMDQLAAIDMGYLWGQVFPIFTMILLATAALLMNSSALEAKLGQDLPLDEELRALGASSLMSTLAGGLPGYHGVSTTVAGLRIAGQQRITSFVAGGFAMLVFVFGNQILALLPLPILAGFMMWVGFDFIKDWLIREAKAAPLPEALLTIAIFVVIASVGLFEGTVFGLVAGTALFTVNYSRLDPVRSVLTGDVYLGANELSPDEVTALQAQGSAILILKLQGFIFFGTAHGLRQRIAGRLIKNDARHLIVDFEAVTGVDATAVESFHRLADHLSRTGVRLVFSNVNPTISAVFARADLPLGTNGRIDAFPAIDPALAQAQSDLLGRAGLSPAMRHASIGTIASTLLEDDRLANRLTGYLEQVQVSQGDAVISLGDHASDIYFLEGGEVEVIVGSGAQARAVRKLGVGAIIGEIAYYTEGVRSTSVVAATDSILWRFSSATAEIVLREDPELSSAFHAGLARTLATRVQANTRLIEMLQT